MQLAGLRTLVVEPEAPTRRTVFLLHGYDMRPEELAPFAHSLGVPARFIVPQGPAPASPGRFGWWPIDQERRTAALSAGPRDLWQEHPPGLDAARRQLQSAMQAAAARWHHGPLALVGFSQGGMLACDAALRGELSLGALALLSSSRIAFDAWNEHLDRVAGLPVLIAHGERDPDLAFAAGESLRDALTGAGARVSWIAHGDGHVIPLPVWRALRRFLSQQLAADPA